jgi:ubiquinone biosynthesis protein UbiJ
VNGPAEDQTRSGSTFPLRPPTAAIVNHLLKSASWARARLAPFAGKTARFEISPLGTAYTIQPGGDLSDASAAAAADTTFTLTPGLAMRIAGGDTTAWQNVAVAGDAALAREVLFITQNLQWDAEEDLSRIFGDVIAHRMVSTAGEFMRWQRDTARNFAQSMSAYWTEERPLVASKHDIDRFVRDVDELRDDVARFEKRIDDWLRTQNPSR